jgi:hypothetical protein
LGAVACWLFVAGLRSQRCAIVDDAFITFRFAENLQLGRGLVWNAGEPPAEGASNLTLVALLALFGDRFDMPQVASAVGALSALGTAIGIGLAARRQVSAAARWLSASLFLVLPATAVHAQAGLETSLYACALTWLALALARLAEAPGATRLLAAGAAYGAVMLSRPEAGVIAGAGILAWLAQELCVRKDPGAARRAFGTGVLCAALLAVSLAWKLSYFGTLLSPPYWVKAAGDRALPGARYVAHFVLDYGVLWLASLVGAVWMRRRVLSWICAAIALANTAFFVFTAPLVAFEGRYLYPVLPLLFVLGAPVLDRALARLPTRATVVIAPLALLALALVSNALRSEDGSWHVSWIALRGPAPRCEETWTGRDRQIGLRLAALDPSGTIRIATEDAGAVAYYTRAPVLDLVGLTQEAMARTASAREFADRVFAFQPDVILLRSRADGSFGTSGSGHGALGRFGKTVLLDDPRFAAYRPIAEGSSGGPQHRWRAWGRVDGQRGRALTQLAGYEAERLR